jgi:hypothetical protein
MGIFSTLRLDLRKVKNVIHTGCTHRCGVLCTSCQWRGHRHVYYLCNLSQSIGFMELTDLVKGKPSRLECPKCLKDTVVFTHAMGRNG